MKQAVARGRSDTGQKRVLKRWCTRCAIIVSDCCPCTTLSSSSLIEAVDSAFLLDLESKKPACCIALPFAFSIIFCFFVYYLLFRKRSD